MNFNSWQFLVFFPLVAALYWVITTRFRHGFLGISSNALSRFLLFAASLFFYLCWNPVYLTLILFSVAVTWVSGILMEGRPREHKKLVLAASLVLNLAVLFFFKYYNFFAGTVNALFSGPGSRQGLPALNVLLPVGISFYTFQALGYSIDVYRGTVAAERNFLTYGLFVTFFPQLVAGPIERSGSLLPQFKADHGFDYDRVTSGLRLAAWGMFKKVVVADRLAVYVNGVYGNPAVYPGCALVLATVFFTFQIYGDFSGYSDIASGTARVLGFNLMTNFRSPYSSRSITEFWRRWHISLSTWLKDYIYIPLGGNRKGSLRQKLNLLITFLLSGLWHGAAWHFVFWGLLHGLFQIVERGLQGLAPQRDRPHPASSPVPAPNPRAPELPPETSRRGILRLALTFILVSFTWIFFRANSMADALLILAKLTALPRELAGYLAALPKQGIANTLRLALQLGSEGQGIAYPIEGFGAVAFITSLLVLGVLLAAGIWPGTRQGAKGIKALPLGIRWAGYYALVLVLILSWTTESSEFIYFTF
jgi:D-alanyl-lipoteichoic acid acyltransferase DltB (MBOAT superfamily)